MLTELRVQALVGDPHGSLIPPRRGAERHGLLDPSQRGFRRLHSTQRQVQSLHWAFEQATDQRKQLWVVYLDFANALNSVDHEALWWWLRESNVPDHDVDLLRSLYDKSYYVADLSYGQSAPIPLTRGTKQGDKLSRVSPLSHL